MLSFLTRCDVFLSEVTCIGMSRYFYFLALWTVCLKLDSISCSQREALPYCPLGPLFWAPYICFSFSYAPYGLRECNSHWFICHFRHCISLYLLSSLRISPFLFQGRGCKRWQNLAVDFCIISFCYRCIFAFVVLSQETGWVECLSEIAHFVSSGM